MANAFNPSRPSIRSIIPYEPGKPISEVQRELGLKDVIKLASNENPLGPSPLAIKAIQEALPQLHLYPDGAGYYLRDKLARRWGVKPSQIALGNGSAELVELVTEAFVGQGEEAVIGRQAFFKYRIAVQIMAGVVVWADMPNFTYNADEILKRITSRTKVVFIANPNNPTGTLMRKEETAYLMERLPEKVIAVFDEAYYDYRNPEIYPDIMQYINAGRSAIILRTFSKSYGLAALRVGYAISTEPLAWAMNAVREAFNVNTLGQVAALAALDDTEFLERSLALNAEGKLYFYRQLERLGWEYVPSEANFVLIQTPLRGRELFQRLLRKGVIVRPVDGYGLPYHVRVSIGLERENEKFFHELEAVLK
ncbi:MAG: histidinol-phosphate transaminase [Calditrichota bacterium]